MSKSKVFVISGMSSAIAVVVQPIESLRFYVDEDGCIRMNSDVNLLMNAERIRNQIGEENYLNIVRSIQPSRSPYKQKLNGCFNIAIYISSILYCFNNRRKIVICQNHCCSVF